MKRITFFVLLALAIPSYSFAEITKLPAATQKALRDASRFHPIEGTTKLPRQILELCADSDGRIAEPGQDWQVTDVIINEKLPARRLIWAVTDGEYYVVHYERGGIAHIYHVLVAKLKSGESKPSFVWQGTGKWLKDFTAFLDAVANNKLDDRLNYTH